MRLSDEIRRSRFALSRDSCCPVLLLQGEFQIKLSLISLSLSDARLQKEEEGRRSLTLRTCLWTLRARPKAASDFF